MKEFMEAFDGIKGFISLREKENYRDAFWYVPLPEKDYSFALYNAEVYPPPPSGDMDKGFAHLTGPDANNQYFLNHIYQSFGDSIAANMKHYSVEDGKYVCAKFNLILSDNWYFDKDRILRDKDDRSSWVIQFNPKSEYAAKIEKALIYVKVLESVKESKK